MRNAQISDLQQKVCPTDLDSRIRSLAEGVQSLGESRTVSKQLLKTLVQQRRLQASSLNEQRTTLDELRAQLLDAQQQEDAASKRLRLLQSQHEEQMLAQQRAYEEKVSVLIRTANQRWAEARSPAEDQQRNQILEELLSSREALQQELDKLRAKNKSKSKAVKSEPQDLDDSFQIVDGNETVVLSDVSDDPDWVPSTSKSKRIQSDSRNVISPPEKQDANVTSLGNSSIQSLNSTSATEDGKRCKGCKCRTKCTTKRCGCLSGNNACSETCVCKSNCRNPLNLKDHASQCGDGDGQKDETEDADKSDDDGDDEPQTSKENAVKFVTPEAPGKVVASPKQTLQEPKAAATPLMNSNVVEDINGPKLAKMSGLAFDTPKRKFF